MLFPKNTLEAIEFYTYEYKYVGQSQVSDIITIHFRSWWRFKLVITIPRNIVKQPDSSGHFTHQSSPNAEELIEQLAGYARQTFGPDGPNGEPKKKATVLHLLK